jgi:hypothetical protein
MRAVEKKETMRTPKRWSVAFMLFASVIPVFGYASPGGSKNWFLFPQGSTAHPQHRNNHPAVKHYVANHPKPRLTKNFHPRTLKRNKPS